MTTKLSSGRARLRRSTAALGIAGLLLAGVSGPAFADGDLEDAPTSSNNSNDEPGDQPAKEDGQGGEPDDGEGAPEEPTELPGGEVEESDEHDDDGSQANSVATLASTKAAAATSVAVDLVGLNDFHGRIDADRNPSAGKEGAAVNLAAAVEEARADNPNTFFVGAGDLYSASTFTSMAGDDVPTTDVFNAIGMDASSVGNHEFDYGFQNLQDRINGVGDYAGHAITWEYLGANVYKKGTDDPALPEYTVVETDDVSIALIGLVTQDTPSLVTPTGIEGLDFGNPAEAVDRVISENADVSDADAIVILTHDGGSTADAVADTSTNFGKFAEAMGDRGDIAGIFSGHTHTEYEVEVSTTMAEFDKMPVIQTGSFGENLGALSLTFEVDDDEAALSGVTSSMRALGEVAPPAQGENTVVDAVRDIVDKAVAAAETVGSEVIGEAGESLLRATHVDPKTGNTGENRGGESTISNLIADSQLWALRDRGGNEELPVIAFMNPGGVRTDIPKGTVTYQQVANVQPFANTLETLDLTGAQIKQVLEEQWQPAGSDRPFLKLGVNAEFFYTYDPAGGDGDRITAMFLDGELLDLAATYRVVTNNFLAGGGDDFVTFKEGTNVADTGLVDLAAIVDYFKAHAVVDPDYTQRAIGVHWATGADAVYADGDPVEIDLSSLVFSNDEPKPEQIEAELVNSRTGERISMGEFDVDPAVVNAGDESGRATISFLAPSAKELGYFPGDWDLHVSDDGDLLALPLKIEFESTTSIVDLVGLNDFHGRIDAGRGEGDEGAAVRLAAAVEEARAKYPDTFFVGAGDLYSASTFTSMAGDDVPTTDVFNAIEMDTSSVGNHEFDYGFQNLEDRINGVGDYAGHAIEWDYLGANVYDEATGDPVLDEYRIVDADDVTVAFIGLVTQETPSLVTPKGIEGLTFGDPTEAVERVISQNSAVSGADAIVILTHDGGVNGEAVSDTSTHFGKFAKAMADRGDIAGVFSGHTHTKYQVDVPTTMAHIGNMPVIQTGSFGENLGSIGLAFEIDADDNATLIAASSGMRPLAGVKPPSRGKNAVVDKVRDIVAAAVAEAEKVGSVTIGEAGADLRRATHVDPQTGDPGENRGGESTISNLIADAQLWSVHEQAATDNLPVIAFMNPGGVREDIEEGNVTYKQVADVQPFANTLETLDLTGAQIKQVLEEQWQPDGASRPFLKLGVNEEFFYLYDPEAPRDERVTHMFLDGNPIELDQTYRVVTNNFLASGGDNFSTLGEGSGYADTGLVDLAAFVDYFKAHDVVSPDYAQRAVGVHWVSEEEGTYGVGDEVEIALSSLVFANDEPKPDQVAAVLRNLESGAEIPVGEFEVDPEIVNTNDEMGRAVVEFAMPEIDVAEDPASWILEITDDLDLLALALDITVEQVSDETPPPTDEDEDGDGGGDDAGAAPGDDMPDTGTDVSGMLIATALLLAIGGTALAVRRRQTMS